MSARDWDASTYERVSDPQVQMAVRVLDHERLFARLYAALRPGAPLVGQCGGEGNIERFHALADAVAAEPPFAEHFAGFGGAWNFASAETTADRLAAAGFEEVETWLEDWPVVPPDPRDYMRTVCLGCHLERLPGALRDAYLDAVVERAGPQPELHYVRLNIVARRAPD